jgi:hypothetical protein
VSDDRALAVAAVVRALDETEAEWGQLPFFVRPMVRRGFVSRTGHDLAAWRALLASAARGAPSPELPAALDSLVDHFRGAGERAKKGMGATAAQLAMIEARNAPRIAATLALRALLAPPGDGSVPPNGR